MAEQLDIFSDAVGKWQRQGQAETSHRAALSIYPLSGTKRAAVLRAVAAAGVHGATDEELQRVLQMNPSTQRPRRVELVEGGFIMDSGRRRRTSSGREAVVWIVA